MSSDEYRKKKYARIILAYPIVLIAGAVLINLLLLGVTPASIALPSADLVQVVALSAVLLLVNHTWAMTSTELTRLKYGIHATPEEWRASKTSWDEVSSEGVRELERRHNAHRNATENTLYFAILVPLICLISPVLIAVQVWSIGFAMGRLGHTYSYLNGRDGLRGIFMSISLASLYGLTTYIVLSLFI